MNSLVKNSIYKLILNICNLLIPLIIGPYAIRVLNADNMGRVYFAESVFGYFLILSSFGLYQYGLRELSKCRDDKVKLKQLFSSLMIISVLASAITLIIYLVFINYRYSNSSEYTILMLYAVNIVSNAVYVEYVVEALEEYKFITIKTLAVKIIYLVILLLIIKGEGDTNKYVILLLLSTMLNNVISYIYISRKVGYDFSNIEIKKHIKFLIVVVVMANINTLFTQLDRLMIGEFVDKASVTYYTMPQSISGTMNALMLSFTAVALPRLSNILQTKGKDSYENLLRSVSREFYYLLFPVAIGMLVLSKEIMLIYGGSELAPSINTMRIFSIYFVTLGIEYVLTNHILYLNKKEDKLMWFVLVSGIINLLLNTLLVFFGILNATTAIATTFIANTILITSEYIYIKRTLKINYKIFTKETIKTISVCMSFFLVKFIVSMFTSNIILVALFTVILSVGIYGVYVLKHSEQISGVVINILTKIKSKFKK
ncbi:oligosaccharide flippase family protein [Clostridium sp. MB05]